METQNDFEQFKTQNASTIGGPMRLIYSKGTCAFSVHLLLEELGLDYQLKPVSIKEKSEIKKFNSLGYVPVLELDDNTYMTEAVAILQYVAEAKGGERFLPAIGTLERAKCLQWLAYFSSELHQKMAPLFHKEGMPEHVIATVEERLDFRLDKLDQHLETHTYLAGDTYTIADMYAIAILRLFGHVDFSLEAYPAVSAYKERLEARDVVQTVTDAEDVDSMNVDEVQVEAGPIVDTYNLDEYTLNKH